MIIVYTWHAKCQTLTEFKLNDLLNTDIFNKKKGGDMDTQTILRFINGASNVLLLLIICLVAISVIYNTLIAIRIVTFPIFTKEERLKQDTENILEKTMRGTRWFIRTNTLLFIYIIIKATPSSLQRELIENIGAVIALTAAIEILGVIKLKMYLKEKKIQIFVGMISYGILVVIATGTLLWVYEQNIFSLVILALLNCTAYHWYDEYRTLI